VTNYVAEVEGAAALEASLGRVANDLDNMPGAGAKAGQAVKQRAASNAPVRTGALARSIYAEAGPAEVVVGARERYAAFQEYGTVTTPASPYLRPALEASTNQIVEAYADEIENKLETVRGA
jgi:HK97 gp10 family phage protein